MPTISVSLEERSYQVQVANGALDTLGYMAEKLRLSGKAAVITDSNVCPLYAERVIQSLRDAEYESSLHVFEAGEQSKNLRTVEEIVNEMVADGHDRSSFIVALGGGVVGDMAGFIASIYYRGIPFIQVPTTVMAQVDSSVGGKTAVDIEGGKNLIGAFYQPKLVIADPMTLLTLSPRVLREGLAEMVKHAALREPKMLQTLQRLSGEIDLGFTLSTIERLPELIAQNIKIKARIVEADEQETQGVRAFLNLGHTLGHGIEASVPYGELLHGEVVSLGLRAALYLSERYAGMPTNEAQEVLRTLRSLELPLQLPPNVDTAKALAKTAFDKKFVAGAIRFVLLQGLGRPILSQEVTQEDLAEALHMLTTPTLAF
ncbi:MAG: 3-dehydroquinate synthase [Akkermansiaceae bacterium]|nr:3-dehydroquinate synthase [Akkermansiaceae bacterium]